MKIEPPQRPARAAADKGIIVEPGEAGTNPFREYSPVSRIDQLEKALQAVQGWWELEAKLMKTVNYHDMQAGTLRSFELAMQALDEHRYGEPNKRLREQVKNVLQEDTHGYG